MQWFLITYCVGVSATRYQIEAMVYERYGQWCAGCLDLKWVGTPGADWIEALANLFDENGALICDILRIDRAGNIIDLTDAQRASLVG